MKKLVLATMLAAFAAAVTLPIVVTANDALAAEKKKTSTEKMKPKAKKKPTGKM